MGGGSSNGATTLAALNQMWKLNLPLSELQTFAARLGSDVPFFLAGGLARCRGRGEKIEPLEDAPPERRLHFVLAYPRFQIPTSLIYRELDRQEPRPDALTSPPPIDTMTAGSIHEALWRGETFFNRLEGVACRAFPDLGEFKKEIQGEPFIATLMSGSGSTVYGVTRSRREAEEIAARLRPRLSGSLFVADCEPADSFAR
jgi:4-diphosphocytidyl-2-C-methyl-D-erythritol kinase